MEKFSRREFLKKGVDLAKGIGAISITSPAWMPAGVVTLSAMLSNTKINPTKKESDSFSNQERKKEYPLTLTEYPDKNYTNMGVAHSKESWDKDKQFIYKEIEKADLILLENIKGKGYFAGLASYTKKIIKKL